MQGYILRYGEKTVEAVLNLPEEELTWVVYNANMVQSAVTLIVSIRGIDFLDEYVTVVSRGSDTCARGKLYFDPNMFKLLGNGYD